MIKDLRVATPGLDQPGVQDHQPWFAASCHSGPCPARLTLSRVAQDLQTLRCPAGKRNPWWGSPSRVTLCLHGCDSLFLEPITVSDFFFFFLFKSNTYFFTLKQIWAVDLFCPQAPCFSQEGKIFTFTPLLLECLSFASGLAVGQSVAGRVSGAGPREFWGSLLACLWCWSSKS